MSTIGTQESLDGARPTAWCASPPQLMAAGIAGLLLYACSGAFGPAIPVTDAGKPDAARMRDASGIENPVEIPIMDASTRPIRDAAADAFFVDDPAPQMCGPDGSVTDPPPVGGTPDCPADKNREGCGCPTAGMQVACWPGSRKNRNHGICVDGKTTCVASVEFAQAWGPCMGYVLPKDDATSGPEACRCFSNGKWAISNLVPCINGDSSGPYIYSSHPDPDTGFACDAVSETPPPAPKADWSTSTLNGECAGQFKLCYEMKAGEASHPKASDCTLMRTCIDVWYAHAGQTQTVPNLPGWSATDTTCTKRFIDVGGYGEMSVIGTSIECDPVNDGNGDAYVFERTAYCSAECGDNPDADGCMGCAISGAGNF